MGAIFISHSSQDNLAALALQRWLETQGWGPEDIFLDLHGIGAGARWKEALKAANARCEAIIFLASPEALASKECGVELRMAEDYDKPILPAIIRGLEISDDRLDGWRDRQIVDLTAAGEATFIDVSHLGQNETCRLALGALESLRTRLIDLGVSPGSFQWPPKNRPNAPVFPGLFSFGEDDAAIFFGRDADIMRGRDRLNALRRAGRPRVVAIQAPSGAGKSSYLKAGLWPRLNRYPEFAPLGIVRPAGGILTGDEGLGQRLAAWFRLRFSTRDPGDISSELLSDPNSLGRFIYEATTLAHSEVRVGNGAAPMPCPIVAIDQAEELFASADQFESHAFLDQIGLLMAKPPEGLNPIILMTIRADSIGPLAEAMRDRGMEAADTMILPPLDRSAYPEIIRGPIAIANKNGRKLEIEPDLVDALVKDAHGADALPLLAFSLARLDADYGKDGRLELSEYEQMGRVAGSITRALSKAREKSGNAGSDENLRALFVPLLATWDAETSAPKRLKANTSELLKGKRIHLTSLLNALVSARLLTQDESSIEVAHEALLRQPPLYTWLEERKESLRFLAEVKAAAKEWRNRADMGARQENWLVHRGERLAYVESTLSSEDYRDDLGADGVAYLTACAQNEKRERDGLLRTIGRSFVKPAQQAAAEGNLDRALRYAAAGACLANDPHFERVPQLWQAASVIVGHNLLHLVARQRFHIEGAILSNDESRILSWGQDRTVRIRDATTGTEIAPPLLHRDTVKTCTFSKDNKRILTWSADNTARIWDAEIGVQIGSSLLHVQGKLRKHLFSEDKFSGASFSNDDTHILSWSGDNACLWDATSGKQIGPALQHDGQVTGARFSANQKHIITWSDDKTVRFWDASTGRQIGPALQHEDKVNGATFSADETLVLTWSDDHTARLWDAATRNPIGPTLQHNGKVKGAAFSNNETLVLTWSDDMTARIWDASTGRQVRSDYRHDFFVTGATFSKDMKRLLTWCRGVTYTGITGCDAKLWDAATGLQIGASLQHEDEINGAAFSNDGTRVLSWSKDKTARIWDAATGLQIGRARVHDGEVYGAAFTKDETRILTWSGNPFRHTADVRLWDASAGLQIGPSLDHDHSVNGAVFSNDETRILSWDERNTARVWDAVTGSQLGAPLMHNGRVSGATYSRDETRILTWSNDTTARIWDAQTGNQMGPALQHGDKVRLATLASDETRIITRSDDGTTKLWDAATGKQIETAFHNAGKVKGTALFRSETRILSWSEDKAALIWNVETGDQIGRALQHEDKVKGATFSKDETRVLTFSDDGTARIWDTNTGSQVGPAFQHEDKVNGAVFSQDGTRILTFSDDSTARIWSASSGTRIGPDLQHEGKVRGAKFSRDETRVFTWSYDKTLRFWDASTGRQIGPVLKHEDHVLSAVFSTDETRVVTASYTQTSLWDATNGNRFSHALRHDEVAFADSVYGWRFSNDGTRILTWSRDKTVRIWDSTTGAQVGPALSHEGWVLGAKFSKDEKKILSWGEDGKVRLWDVSRSLAFNRDAGMLVCAALANGLGVRAPQENDDLLLADAPENLFEALSDRLGQDQFGDVFETANILSAPLHPSCYLAPSIRERTILPSLIEVELAPKRPTPEASELGPLAAPVPKRGKLWRFFVAILLIVFFSAALLWAMSHRINLQLFP